MNLEPFDYAIGISDTLGYRECPARTTFQMRRHTEDGDPPGSTNWTNAYGSAIHEAIHVVETTGCTNEEAVDKVWPEFATYLDPEHLQLLHEDLNTYRRETPFGYELIAAEVDRRVPLFVHEGHQIYYRFKIDALYRLATDHTQFLLRDYKSSAWEKTQKEVDTDIQMWSYNWAIFELYPECLSLIQRYEQLKFGTRTTSKNAEQREQMRQWLIKTVKFIIEDEDPKPKQNQWCPYCPLVVTCSETVRATDYWKGMLAVMAPMTQEGRKLKVEFAAEGAELEEVMRLTLPKMIRTQKHLNAAEKALKGLIQKLPSSERQRLGWRMRDRKTRTMPPDGLREVHRALGDAFYECVTFSKSAAEAVVGKPKKGETLTPEQLAIEEAELEHVQTSTLVHDD